MNGIFFFVLLPYIAIVSLVAGSIYRYRLHGFQVSSLSSQLLENKLLFFGSRPFHWGIIFLFFGHLIAFIIPKTVLAWNEKPVRLYILEISALTFGVVSLIGLIILIVRRIKVKRIRNVTSRMDVFVYVILSIQVITGIYIALFFRWGSSWFAMVLTPYLRSIFLFQPDTTAVLTLPFMVRLHMISAFIFIGMIPYTRFIHILVYPFSYLWRKNQLVIWNKMKNIEEEPKDNVRRYHNQ